MNLPENKRRLLCSFIKSDYGNATARVAFLFSLLWQLDAFTALQAKKYMALIRKLDRQHKLFLNEAKMS
jgi:hypothetical protein